MVDDCYGCRLTKGLETLPGGRILDTEHWVVEHCTGPLGVGTLIVKPLRHCLHVGGLEDEEARELGPLLRRISRLVREMTGADQVYVCLWSHAGWRPEHLHFVVQPSWNSYRETYPGPGPRVQTAMFEAGERPDADEVEAFCREARERLKAEAET